MMATLLKTTFFVVLLAGSALQPATAQSQKLVLGNEGTYPPFSILGTDGSLSGLEPELARAMCERMATECEIKAMDFSALLPSLLADKIDVVATQLNPIPERLEKTEFSRPILMNPEGFVVRKDWSGGFDNTALKGKKIAVQKGSSHARYVEDKLPDAIPTYYENPDQIKLDLLAGRVDAVFGPKINYTIHLIDTPDGKDFMISEQDFWTVAENVGMSWAVRKGEMELIGKINTALDSLIADCSYSNIRKKYVSKQLLPEEPANCL